LREALKVGDKVGYADALTVPMVPDDVVEDDP
jgi:hypothetical protein